MAETETTSILQDIEAQVSDRLQVVSYKWLSRNYSVSSNIAKRLLQDFVEKRETRLQVIYTLSGWLKKDPSSYHVKLVCEPKLAEARKDFTVNCSVQVYSIQACIPKDPAALWNAEFLQAEELFKQPMTVDNCLRDSRFCGITNSFVKRNVEGVVVSLSQPSKSAEGNGLLKSDIAHKKITVPQPKEDKVQKYDPKPGVQSAVTKEVSSECDITGSHHQTSKHPFDEENLNSLPATKKKVQTDKNSISTGSSLANLWGRASAKSKPCDQADANKISPTTTASAEAQIYAREAVESLSSDDDHEMINFRKSSNGEGGRKRRVVFDFSDDEYEDTVDLGLPDNPQRIACEDLKKGTSVSDNISGNSCKQLDDKPLFKGNETPERKSSKVSGKDSSVASKNLEAQSCLQDNDLKNNDKSTNAAPTSPKRRKVLKTRIDERGREVTEVIWEGEETEAKKEDISLKKNSNENTVKNAVTTRPPHAAKKSPALGMGAAPSNGSGKAASKKAGNVNSPKQGNILSFFKKV